MGNPNPRLAELVLHLISVPGPLTHGVARVGSDRPLAVFGLHSDAAEWMGAKNAEFREAPLCTWCNRPLLDSDRDDRFEDMHTEPCAGEYARHRQDEAAERDRGMTAEDAADAAFDEAFDVHHARTRHGVEL